MHSRIILACLFSAFCILAMPQGEQALNQTDKSGRKQGHWIRYYPNGNILYDGFFRNDMPVGEFKRFYEDRTLKSLLEFNADGTEANATLYFSNGFPAAKGKYINQLKEGRWQFFSVSNKGVVISEEEYLNDKKNGVSRKFYPDSTVAEVTNFRNNFKHGECLKYHPDGSILLKTMYFEGKLNGSFEAFFDNGKKEVIGNYKNNLKEGLWIIYGKEGNQRFKTEYKSGVPDNPGIDIYETNYIDSLEKHRVLIADPDKTGEIW